MYLGSLYIIKYKALVKYFDTIETGVQGCSHLTVVLSREGVLTPLACSSSLFSQIAGAHWKVTQRMLMMSVDTERYQAIRILV